MKKILMVLVMLCVWGLISAVCTYSAPLSTPPRLVVFGTTTFEGTLMKIEGNIYVIMDSEGKDHRVHVDGNTSITGNVQPGAKVVAEVTDEGYASTLKKVEK